MDLSWCIMCDQRIDDLEDSSLYCSDQCRVQDVNHSSHNSENKSAALLLDEEKQAQDEEMMMLGGHDATNKVAHRFKTLRAKQQANKPASSYPWVMNYTRSRSKRPILVKRCQPMVASSLTTATAFFAPKPFVA
ncbi:hypothetical protein BC940DRAFT_310780 [Gongronella butleri]|nr:hypothetical protein BC940DRAFT_310780 [Gongronella butleri]